MAFATAATAISVGASVYGGIQSKKGVKGAAAAQRAGAAQAGQDIDRGEDEARGIYRGAADEYSQSLRQLSPYQGVGTAGIGLLGKYAGIEDLVGAGGEEAPVYQEPQESTYKGIPLGADIDPQRFAQLLERADATSGAAPVDKILAILGGSYAGQGNEGVAMANANNAIESLKNQARRSPEEMAASRAKFEGELAAYNKRRADRIAAAKADPEFGSSLKGFTNADFEKEPGYEFRRGEGTRGLTNLYGSQGQLLSGNALRGVTEFNQDYASNEFQRGYERDKELKLRKLGLAQDLVGVGQLATGTRVSGQGNLATLRTGEADLISKNAATRAGISQDQGNISAAERVGKAQAYSDLFTGVAGGLSSGISAYRSGRGASGGRGTSPWFNPDTGKLHPRY